MALFSKADLTKPKYIESITTKIRAGEPLKVSSNNKLRELVFDYTEEIKELELRKRDLSYYKEILYPNEKYAKIFKTSAESFQFNNIDKSQFSGISHANSLGKKLSDAAERSTIKAIQYHSSGKKILSPACTSEKVFIDNPNLFSAWKNTFEKTPLIVDNITRSALSNYQYVHDASRDHFLSDTIRHITKISGCAKDTWNPSDLWVVKKGKQEIIKNEFTSIIKLDMVDTEKLKNVNLLIKDMYESDYLYPISLKQIVTDGRYEISNYRSEDVDYDFSMLKMPCDFSMNDDGSFKTKEIGVFSALNNKTRNVMTFQVRGFPHGYRVAQTEITSSGENSGGRIGKIPASVLDMVMKKFNCSRIKSIKEFDTIFETYDLISMYENITNDSYFRTNINNWINRSKIDYDFKSSLCIKLQGLIIADFLRRNNENINEILTAFLLGAKKINPNSSLFIKIY